jgi:transcriptional regulator with GAF, ATPase, and Fis domain
MKKTTQSNPGLDTAHYGPEVNSMLEGARVCLLCGKKLTYLQNKGSRRNRGYCCLKHYYAYPPKLAYIAHAYGKPAREAITEALNAHSSVGAAAGLLGIGKPQLYAYMRKLNIKKVLRYE